MKNPLMADWTDKTPCEDPVYNNICPLIVNNGSIPINSDGIFAGLFDDCKLPHVVDLLLPFEDDYETV